MAGEEEEEDAARFLVVVIVGNALRGYDAMARCLRNIAMLRHSHNATNDDMPNTIVLSLTNASRRDLFSMIMAALAPYCSDHDDDDDDDDNDDNDDDDNDDDDNDDDDEDDVQASRRTTDGVGRSSLLVDDNFLPSLSLAVG